MSNTTIRPSCMKNGRRKTPRLELRGMTKAYPGIMANDGVDLKVMPGEIHAVLGENGAGKSTLMKMIYGVVKPDRGRILWEGKPVAISSPAQARQLGIGMVFQHFCLFETLTVAENIALAMKTPIKPATLAKRIRGISKRYGLPLEPDRLVYSLSVGLRQRVEIVRCLLQDHNLLIMDEPTAVLSPQAVDKLFATLKKLADEGCSILYISHKLTEIQALCHQATIIRYGRVTGRVNPARETPSSLAGMMIGKEIPVCLRPPGRKNGQKRLEVKALSCPPMGRFGTGLKNISFQVLSGQVLGLAGISGNGQRELLAVLSGERRSRSGEGIIICGVPAGRLDVGTRRDLGLCFVPGERMGKGAVPGLSLLYNALLTAFRQGMVRFGMINRRAAARFTAECIADFDVRCGGVNQPVTGLSGGNLQKFITGREILQAPKLLLVCHPTRGVDVGAAHRVRQSIIDLRDKGAAILVISEDLDELFEMCDRIVVMAQGHVSPSKRISETSRGEIGMWMGGLFPGGPVRVHPEAGPV